MLLVRRRAAQIAAVLIAGGMLGATTACGADTPPAPTSAASSAPSGPTTPGPTPAVGPAGSPCTLLTGAEVAAALGEVTDAPRPGQALNKSLTCRWDGAGYRSIALVFNTPSDTGYYRDTLKSNQLNDGEQRLPIGDTAVLRTGQGVINVLVGDKSFQISNISGDDQYIPDNAMAALAKTAAARLR